MSRRIATLACLAALTISAAACGGTAAGTTVQPAAPSPVPTAPSPSPASPTALTYGTVGDWAHEWQMVRQLQADPPKGLVVYYIGDSTARESIVSDASWAADVHRLGGPPTRTVSLAGHDQSFAMDLNLVSALPSTPGIALIGVGLSRMLFDPTAPMPSRSEGGQPLADGSTPPPGAAAEAGWVRHHYDGRRPYTLAQQRGIARRWIRWHTGEFSRNRAPNMADLGKLIALCRAKGLRPVLVDMPFNLAAGGHILAEPRGVYRRACTRLARHYGIHYASFLRALDLPSSDFWDNAHLLRAGYVRWQRQLARLVVNLAHGG
jgi:hypothetical protein